MITDSNLLFKITSTPKEDGIIENSCWIISDNGETQSNDEIVRLQYNNQNPSRVYSNLCLADIFDHYSDSYNIKIFRLLEVLGFQSNTEPDDNLKFEVFDLLENDYDVGDLREILNIDIHLVILNGEELGYLVKDYECDEDDLANFYFINEETAKKYFKKYFKDGTCLLEMKEDSKSKFIEAGEPKPFDIDILLNYYSSIDDLIFDKLMKVCEFKSLKGK